MAPLTRCRKAAAVAAAAPVIDPADHLSQLPESILADILSCLPDQEAVRTCVLGRAWRHIWKFTTWLLIARHSVQEVRAFVDGLLRARLAGLADVDDGTCGGGPLDVCEFQFRAFQDKDVPIVNSWIRLAVVCRVQCLNIDMWRDENNHYFRMSDRLLVSQHLTSLRLSGVCFRCEYLDFSGCPALDHLEIHHSSMAWVRKMTSPSVRYLVITHILCSQEYRGFRICVPRLVSLWLEAVVDRNLVLESMLELEVACVKIYDKSCINLMGCEHVINGDYFGFESDTEEELDDCGGQNTTKCMLLGGLSQAQDLELMACKATDIFRRDLKWCPTFFKLKTLVLDDHWCEPADCRALVCLLKHTPVLEELTVEFFQQHEAIYNVEVKGYLDAAVDSNMMLKCLKEVKVKCHEVDKRALSILNYLETLNICFQIRVAKG